MAGAGILEGFLHWCGDAGFDTEENPGEEGCFGVRPELIDGIEGAFFKGVDRLHQRIALFFFEQSGAIDGHVTVDALPGEVIAVGKLLGAWRRLNAAAQHDTIAIVKIFIDLDAC